jgi:hypothetical protein
MLITVGGAGVALLDSRYLASTTFADHETADSVSTIQIADALAAVAKAINVGERQRRKDRIEDIEDSVLLLKSMDAPPRYVEQLQNRREAEIRELQEL